VFNDYRNPKKLIEYFATGKPVVALSNREMNYFRDLVNVVGSAKEFETAIRDVLAFDPADIRKKRIDYAVAHTWDEISLQASDNIEDVMRSKKMNLGELR
jgi:hypothetical protein